MFWREQWGSQQEGLNGEAWTSVIKAAHKVWWPVQGTVLQGCSVYLRTVLSPNSCLLEICLKVFLIQNECELLNYYRSPSSGLTFLPSLSSLNTISSLSVPWGKIIFQAASRHKLNAMTGAVWRLRWNIPDQRGANMRGRHPFRVMFILRRMCPQGEAENPESHGFLLYVRIRPHRWPYSAF